MFGNKKQSLPPRPNFPNPEHILEDLSNASADDVAFKVMNEDNIQTENLYISTDHNNSEDIYKKVKIYLNVKEQLKQLEVILKKEQEQLQKDNEEIRALADSIRKQAQAALIT
ncbi:PREDICTED: UPF0449 protein C19orf25-like [Polistes canadensis]|uniref:UPF0449 protein C19orf25-like n=1 Tax=Polistes canadensis TaxID=91411 RepID=UPI000718C232|nr:PREDICTED: UPF0449 protein C19orf25-like [Polistes canadensis]